MLLNDVAGNRGGPLVDITLYSARLRTPHAHETRVINACLLVLSSPYPARGERGAHLRGVARVPRLELRVTGRWQRRQARQHNHQSD